MYVCVFVCARAFVKDIKKRVFIFILCHAGLLFFFCLTGIEKDVVILQKKHPGEENLVSLLGKGIIPVEPEVVCNTLKNPHSRYACFGYFGTLCDGFDWNIIKDAICHCLIIS